MTYLDAHPVAGTFRLAPRDRRAPAASARSPRALELLAGCGVEGCTESLMLAHGLTIEQMVELVRAGLASATAERVVAGSRKMEVATLRIMEAGRRALAGR